MAETKKKLTEEEIARRSVTGQPIDPSQGDTPQARTGAALRGMGESVGIYAKNAGNAIVQGAKNVGGFLADSAVTAGNTGVMGRGNELPNAGMQSPQDQGLRGAPVNPPRQTQPPAAGSPAADSTPVQTSTPATAPNTVDNGVVTPTVEQANNVGQLRKMGLTNAQINMPAVGGGQQGRRAVIQGGSNGFVNLGNYGQEGQGNIYGRSSTPGGRMDTFVGAGPNAGFNAQGQATTTGADGKPTVYNPTGYDPNNPYGGAHANAPMGASIQAGMLRQGRVAPARAGDRQFPGSGGLRQSELRNINAQANRAFNQALESGMNTKAATRIAENIRAGGGLMVDQDKNDASRYSSDNSLAGVQYASDTNLAGQALREQGAMTRAQQRQMADRQKAQFEMFADQFVGPDGKRDKARLARVVQNAGGLDRFMNASPEVQQKLMTRGNALAQLVENAEQITAKDGTVYSTFDALSGGAKLPGSDATIMDAIRSGNISLLDAISGADKIELGDGTLIEYSDLFGDFDAGNLVGMSPEDRRDIIEWIDGRGE